MPGPRTGALLRLMPRRRGELDLHQRASTEFPYCSQAEHIEPKEYLMDKDRVIGSAKVVKGKVKEAVGQAMGDAKLEAEGKADKVEGKVQNLVGGLKDTLRGE